MVEILKSFEQLAGRLSPAVLIAPGLAMAVLGLLAWLGGMSVRRLVLALMGAAVGLLAGFLFGKQNSPASIVAAGGGAALGVAFPRLFAAVLLAVLGAAITFAVVAKAYAADNQGTLLGAPGSAQVEQRLSATQSLDVLRAFAFDVMDRTEAVAHRLLPAEWAVIAAVGAGLFMLGLFFVRPAGALTCSVLGTMLIFAGLVALLMFKGSSPIAYLERQGAFYGMVLLGMAAFGALEQLLLCGLPQSEPKASSGKSRARQEEAKRGWRNR